MQRRDLIEPSPGSRDTSVPLLNPEVEAPAPESESPRTPSPAPVTIKRRVRPLQTEREATIELTDSEDTPEKQKASRLGSIQDQEGVDAEDDELGADAHEHGSDVEPGVIEDAPGGKAEEYASQFMRWAGFMWAWAGWWGKDGRTLVQSMLGPLMQIEMSAQYKVCRSRC